MLNIPSSAEMLSIPGPLTAGSNQVTKLFGPNKNPNGAYLLSIYTQVIQAMTQGNLAQSLIVAAKKAPTDFESNKECFPIYRTYQDGVQTPITPAGGTPLNLLELQIPEGWGMWQIVNIVGESLVRNNIRLGIVFK